MATDSKKITPTTVADIVRTTGQLSVPEGMSLKDAGNLLLKKAVEEEQVTSFQHDFPKTLPNDGAWALKSVLDKMFASYASAPDGKTHETFFGPIKEKPRSIAVENGPNGETIDIPWGTYYLPNGISMTTEAQFNKQTRIFNFVAHGECQRRFIPVVNEVISALKAHLKENSLYRGKALRVEFTEDDGTRLEQVQLSFIDLSKFNEEQGIYSNEVAEEIRALVYSPMSSPRPKKIGVLLCGLPGVGKTLAMSIAARKAQEAGRTVVYCDSRDFTTALRFAANYEGKTGAVVVCEDIDRILGGPRDANIDSIYNAMDGPDTKHSNVSVLLTTNDLAVIPDNFIRPGRVRQTLELTPPDADAVLRLMEFYGKDRMEVIQRDQLKIVATRLAGRIPATVADVIARALDIAEYKGRDVCSLADIEVAERSMTKQLHLLDQRSKVVVEDGPRVRAAKIIAEALTVAPGSKSNGNGGFTHSKKEVPTSDSPSV